MKLWSVARGEVCRGELWDVMVFPVKRMIVGGIASSFSQN